MSTVLVTGGSGFVGCYCVAYALNAGHTVRVSVRKLSREAEVRAMVKAAGATRDDYEFVAADLTQDAGWAEAVAGCDYVLHVASPFPTVAPKHEDELIIPARDGALRVLKAARDAGVKRVVLTSSFVAIGYGHKDGKEDFDESDWTDATSPLITAYAKSKTLAERAAWDFVKDGGPELAVVNPVGVFGPAVGASYSSSVKLVQRILSGKVPGCPDVWFGAVDVRDVADLHLRAMTSPAAAGERFLAVAGDFVRFVDIATILKTRMGASAKKVTTRRLPNWLVKIVALADKSAKQIVPDLGQRKNASNSKARELLGWTPRSVEEATVAAGESVLHRI